MTTPNPSPNDWKLERNERFAGRPGPLVLVVMDGVGWGRRDEGDAVFLARTPTLDRLMDTCPWTKLRAHGTAVGLPSDDDMGNSEVGHNALGAGRVYEQGAKLVNRQIETGDLFRGEVWRRLVANCRARRAPLHFIGLLSDGNVHSHISHLFAMIRQADRDGVTEVCIHALLDGRDVPATSALEYIDALEALLAEVNAKGGRRYRIASGGGRMLVTMDRYEADWEIVRRGWRAHVLGDARRFPSARAAIETVRAEQPGIADQFLPAFVVEERGEPAGAIGAGASVVFFNFRGDRAIEVSRAFEEKDLTSFDRGPLPDLLYAGMMQYDGDLGIPKTFLVSPPNIERTAGECLARNAVAQFACAETQKYGHVTYFWNGNRGGMFDERTERYVEIPSDRVRFEQRPWMKSAEVTDRVVEEILSGRSRFVRVNYANGDMVGHTGHLTATILAVESVDLGLARIVQAVEQARGIALVTADHGNADQMFEVDKKTGRYKVDKKTGNLVVRTSHSLNPVPFVVHDPLFAGEWELDPGVSAPGLSNVAAAILGFLGLRPPPFYDRSLVRFR